ncbi:hypothetical protein H3146_05915 [Streptomyces sp. OF3]|uniref:Uncharacterized protein n=1 Tax=Streptomyces alkaliterrae TaxID=2213162 RepID=A0A7W3WIC3_9ACTN|nr:hypothetical protein [Streptomyces alkaliterrae]MBB1252903.1 hypothetical protein [Streptomyces alkaliterrae]
MNPAHTRSAIPTLPGACPPWCRDRGNATRHTTHWGTQQRVANPRPLSADGRTVMRAELHRNDGATVIYVQGESDIDLTAAEADKFIADVDAWLVTLRAMRAQMN